MHTRPRCASRSTSYQLVTDSTHRPEQSLAGHRLELGAEPAHVDVEQVGVDVIAGSPDLVGDQRAGKDAPVVLHENLEQGVLAPRQLNPLALHLHGVAEQVELNAGVLERRVLYRRLA